MSESFKLRNLELIYSIYGHIYNMAKSGIEVISEATGILFLQQVKKLMPER